MHEATARPPANSWKRLAGVPAYALFYPAAAAYSVLFLPASVLAMTGAWVGLPALAHPGAHAHEMLLGYALAVVAGNQLGVARGPFVAGLLVLWILARMAFVVAPSSLAAAALDSAFAGALAVRLVPRLAGAAKKWRNRALPAVIGGICAAAIAWHFAQRVWGVPLARSLVVVVVLLFATLMLFMGGRIIAPAVAGQLYRQGEPLGARVQPRLEGALLVCGGAAIVLALVPDARSIAAACAATAGALGLVRMARWRLWRLRGRPDLYCLAAGYAWLGIGLIALGAALAAGRHETAAIHLITIGALGTLTLSVMGTLWVLQARRDPARAPTIVWGTLLIAAAALARLLGAYRADAWLLVSAVCWSTAHILLLLLFARTKAGRRNH